MNRASAALGLLALVAAGEALAQDLRYSDTAPGGIAVTGNTMGLSKALSQNGPGVYGSIGTFMSLDLSSVDDSPANPSNPWPVGTTNDWTANGSAAVLDLPAAAEIAYAELVWAGSWKYGVEDLSAYLDDAVTLSSGGDELAVNPAAATALTLDEVASTDFAVRYYVRSADVTSFVRAHGAGSYAVSGIPATQDASVNTLNAAGWALLVAYRDDNQPIRNLSIFVGGSFVDEASTQDYAVSGFCSPPFGPVEGNVVIGALEGDADLAGDTLTIAPTAAGPFQTLSGPNNPSTNFFASQINDRDGLLDTRGTFGTSNHDAFGATNAIGGRQGWDLTRVPLSDGEGTLANDQTSAVLRTVTEGDSYLPSLVAMEIDVKAPDLTNSTSVVTPTAVRVGDVVTLTATLDNRGAAEAADLRFRLSLPAELEIVSFTTDGESGDGDGAAVSASRLAGGVPAGTLDVDATRVIELELEIVDEPVGDAWILAPTWEHRFVVCEGEPSLDETHTPAAARLTFLRDVDTDTDTDTDTEADTSDIGDTDGTGDDERQCGCAAPVGGQLAWTPLLGLLALAAARRRR